MNRFLYFPWILAPILLIAILTWLIWPDPVHPFRVTMEPVEVPVQFTAYYIAEVELENKPEGDATMPIWFTREDGKRIRQFLTPEDYQTMEMEGSALNIMPGGKKKPAYRLSSGEWKELPDGVIAKGNKMNPLVAYRHIAADQGIYPYGSLVHIDYKKKPKLPDGRAFDGYLWVADVGGMINGRSHFDLFVGGEETYEKILPMTSDKKHKVNIYKLPHPPTGLDPRQPSGLAKLLHQLGHHRDPENTELLELEKSVKRYQKTISHIPKQEHGFRTGAATIWYLTQEALRLSE